MKRVRDRQSFKRLPVLRLPLWAVGVSRKRLSFALVPHPPYSRRLGHLWVRGLNKGPKGTEGAFVTFEINTDGLLTVSAEDCRGGEVNQLTVDNIANFTADRLAQLHEQH